MKHMSQNDFITCSQVVIISRKVTQSDLNVLLVQLAHYMQYFGQFGWQKTFNRFIRPLP